jgi:8-oxo-dGTP pyrophosphatase MutT (NUDIX family)
MTAFLNATYELLKRYDPSYPEEVVYRKKMLEFLETCDDAFLRSCLVGHFTASAFLLNHDKTHVCLMHHTKLNKWVQPGGHCDGDSNILAVAIKEAQEETGITQIIPLNPDIFDLDLHLIPANTKDKAHYHFDIRFFLHACGNDTLIKNHESQELRWVEKDVQLPLDPSVRRLFEKWKTLSL